MTREQIKEYNKKYYQEHKEKIKEKVIEYRNNNREHLIEKQKEYNKKHKDKIKQQHDEYYNNNYEQLKEYRKQYYKEHKDDLLNKASNYYQNNKEIKKEYQKNRRKTNKLYNFKLQIRNMINISFKRKRYYKKDTNKKIIGIEINEFVDYLLNTFKNNYGYEWNGIEKVHIDHIIPLSNANTKEEVMKLCNYKNLQLLKAKDNLQKGSKINYEIKGE